MQGKGQNSTKSGHFGIARAKAQSAMEYLMTYGWAILIIAVILGALYGLGVFNAGNFVGSQCLLQAGFSCPSLFMGSNGLLTINLLQATSSPINITAYGCNTNSTIINMQTPYNPPSNQFTMQIGANYTFSVQCYSMSTPFSGTPGSDFDGYLIINYTNLITGFPETVVGKVFVKIS
ncbi:MAG: hypothetical protein ACP5T3_00765 [Candidatus Micrarchaeia archaeon]